MCDDDGYDMQAAVRHLEDLFEAVVVGGESMKGVRTSPLRIAGHPSVAIGHTQAPIHHGISRLSPCAKGNIYMKCEGNRGARRSLKMYHR